MIASAARELQTNVASDELVFDVGELSTAMIAATLTEGADWDSAVIAVRGGPAPGRYGSDLRTLSADGLTSTIDVRGYRVLSIYVQTTSTNLRRITVEAHADDAP